MRALLVDNDPTARTAVARLLRQLQYDVDVASNAHEAVRAVERHSPDLLVSELQLPDHSGVWLLSIVREHSPKLPVVLITSAQLSSSDFSGFTDLNRVAILRKPLGDIQLDAAIKLAAAD